MAGNLIVKMAGREVDVEFEIDKQLAWGKQIAININYGRLCYVTLAK